TVEQESLLQSMGCDYVQGFYYAKPLSSTNEKLPENELKKEKLPASLFYSKSVINFFLTLLQIKVSHN
ncbi:hypothetical protein ACT453_62525, partial [Bacillus sp. D-CC]